MKKRNWAVAAASAIFLAACGGSGDDGPSIKPFTKDEPFDPNPYPSTYQPFPNAPVLITHATILDGEGDEMDGPIGEQLTGRGRRERASGRRGRPPGA